MSTVLFLRYGFIDIVGAVIAVSIGTGVLKLCVMGDLWLHQGTLWTVYPIRQGNKPNNLALWVT